MLTSVVSNILKRVGGLAGATFASRLLGFFREILTASILGGGTVASAWTLAFMIPNLCRRVFGEGTPRNRSDPDDDAHHGTERAY